MGYSGSDHGGRDGPQSRNLVDWLLSFLSILGFLWHAARLSCWHHQVRALTLAIISMLRHPWAAGFSQAALVCRRWESGNILREALLRPSTSAAFWFSIATWESGPEFTYNIAGGP